MNNELESLHLQWQSLVVLAAASIILGSFAIAVSFMSTLATVVILGSLILAGALVHLLKAVVTRAWAGSFGHVLAAILYGFAGGYMVLHPEASAASLTLVIGLLLAVGGIYQMISSVNARYTNWGWVLFDGVISLGLAFMIYAQWPMSGLWVIGTFVGIDLIFRGWATLMVALSVRAIPTPVVGNFRTQPADRRVGLLNRRVAA